jgi:ATP:corrinoid adenosyltransferase
MSIAKAKKPLRFYLHAGPNKSQDIMTLSLAAAATGVRIYIARFLDDGRYGALKSCSFPITVRYFDLPGLGAPRLGQMMDRILTESSLRQVRADICSGEYDLVILDEVKEALVREAVEPEQIQQLLRSRPAHVKIALA